MQSRWKTRGYQLVQMALKRTERPTTTISPPECPCGVIVVVVGLRVQLVVGNDTCCHYIPKHAVPLPCPPTCSNLRVVPESVELEGAVMAAKILPSPGVVAVWSIWTTKGRSTERWHKNMLLSFMIMLTRQSRC
jgi:hypothetical protein